MTRKANKSFLGKIFPENIFFNQYIEILVLLGIYPALQRKIRGRKLCPNNRFGRQGPNISAERGLKKFVKQHTSSY